MALLAASYFGYSHWFSTYFAAKHQSIDPAKIVVTEPHEFVRTNLVEQVYQSTRLADLSPLDREATAKLASAFSNHPWVREVRSIAKLPDGNFKIDMEYRRPVAAFHVTGESRWLRDIENHLTNLGYSINGGINDLYFPLDGEGYMLPTDQMTLDDTRRLIHIEVSEVFPNGNEGTPFGDRRVESAAMLANLLSAVSDRIQIAKITVSGDPRMNIVPQLSLITGNNTKLLWGSPPGMEQPNERGAKAKLTDLLSGNFVPDGDLRIATGTRGSVR
ncbi:cell division protein FtsQ/DivIB [Roseiconus lacunae]|uniref:Cell division protein FtsQ n=1 Tax=Roseiconus lacunae TaxID=2605694 RepID=A0ABT7PGX7_9BACT|nr:hypothetical protein [Roseiconus lacunae]MCD0460487.1 hypothetical protein [Roseiconus lacunae]MDM4015466.1 hypothetical protein [Roseiconus lacunae]WRQ52856.1 hypothetical protein U8335_09950 [Stieleria sp. HD01]